MTIRLRSRTVLTSPVAARTPSKRARSPSTPDNENEEPDDDTAPPPPPVFTPRTTRAASRGATPRRTPLSVQVLSARASARTPTTPLTPAKRPRIFLTPATPTPSKSELEPSTPTTRRTTAAIPDAPALASTPGTPGAAKNIDEHPEITVGREEERAAIESFLMAHLGPPPTTVSDHHVPSSMYIAGSPGVGKTALLKQLLAGQWPDSPVVLVNCYGLKSPAAVYSTLSDRLADLVPSDPPGPKCTGIAELTRWTACLTSPCVILLDELDALFPAFASAGQSDGISSPRSASSSASTLHPTVLYSLFSLAHHYASRFVLIGIANSLDLTSHLLPHLTGALAPATVTFNPYDAAALKQIMLARFPTQLEPAAAGMIGATVANASSDVRRACEIARTAIRIALMSATVSADEGAPVVRATPSNVVLAMRSRGTGGGGPGGMTPAGRSTPRGLSTPTKKSTAAKVRDLQMPHKMVLAAVMRATGPVSGLGGTSTTATPRTPRRPLFAGGSGAYAMQSTPSSVFKVPSSPLSSPLSVSRGGGGSSAAVGPTVSSLLTRYRSDCKAAGIPASLGDSQFQAALEHLTGIGLLTLTGQQRKGSMAHSAASSMVVSLRVVREEVVQGLVDEAALYLTEGSGMDEGIGGSGSAGAGKPARSVRDIMRSVLTRREEGDEGDSAEEE
ncbi:P-loop containing nucleoside triphosphate hydrolase protein [Blastocladiella britannica]|nr:P-loop containing nucleoside triphosphate hydrolase protein [Blastocladiella britannica]